MPSLASYLHHLETISENVDIHESQKLIVATTGKNLRRFSQFDSININQRGKIQANNQDVYKIFEVDSEHFDPTKRSQGLSPVIESLGESLAFVYPLHERPTTSRSLIPDSAQQFPIC